MSGPLLIVGAGMAAMRLVEELVRRGPLSQPIVMVGAEPEPAYNRVLLSPLLAGDITADDVRFKPREWYAEHGVELVTGDAVIAIDPMTKVASLTSGRTIEFDRCVIATGSDPIKLPTPGAHLPSVVTFRTTAHVARMAQSVATGKPAVVIGGGLLGIEAAYGLARRGVAVTLIHIMDKLMERQLDAEAAGHLKGALEDKGITVSLEAQTAEIIGVSEVEAVRLADGRVIPCGLVVMAAGVGPQTDLAKGAGLAVKRGVLVDDGLATSHPDIYAIGECAEHRGACYGLVEPAYEQARVLARILSGEAAGYYGSVLATNLKISGVPVFSAGDFDGRDAEQIILRDPEFGVYRKLVVRDGKLIGALLYGDTSDALWYFDLIKSGQPIVAFRAIIAFGQAYAEAA